MMSPCNYYRTHSSALQYLPAPPHATSDLEDVVPGPDVGDVDPLAVDVVPVGIPAAHGDALFPHAVARVALLQS